MLSGLLKQVGGLDGLGEKFNAAGLKDIFASWVSTGQNQPVQPAQMQQALGAEAIQDVATKMGLEVKTILPLLAQFLPQIIDKLTPNGSIEDSNPSADQLKKVLASVMGGGLGGFFGGKS